MQANRYAVNRFTSLCLAKYMHQPSSTKLGSDTTGSSEGAVQLVSSGSGSHKSGDQPTHVQGTIRALTAASNLCLQFLNEDTLNTVAQCFIPVALEEGVVFQQQNEHSRGTCIIISDYPCMRDSVTGEEYSRGKIINIESLLFNENTSSQTLVAFKAMEICILDIASAEGIRSMLRCNYLRTKFNILGTLDDDVLASLEFEHHWFANSEHLNLHGEAIAMIASGQASTRNEMLFSGTVIGVLEAMNDLDITLTCHGTVTGIALLSRSQFSMLMKTQALFSESINEMTFQRSVRSQDSGSTVIDTASVRNALHDVVLAVAPCTTTLTTTTDEKDRVVLNQYTILSMLGSGASANVFRARFEVSSSRISERVLKMVKKSSKNSITREVIALTAVQNHHNIVKLHEIIDCSISNVVVLVLELAAFGSLHGCDMPMLETKRVMLQICDALDHVHACGFLHNDIKPANVLRTHRDSVRLCDFGCATRISDNVCKILGTPAFMSPEALSGSEPMSTASDVWSLCVMLYQLAYHRLPYVEIKTKSEEELEFPPETRFDFAGQDFALLRQLLTQGLLKNSSLRPSLKQFQEHPFFVHYRSASFNEQGQNDDDNFERDGILLSNIYDSIDE
jgi:tRNA A-37 threonylcarbamoyl transferase component Bud32